MGLDRPHTQLIGQGESLAVVGGSVCPIWGSPWATISLRQRCASVSCPPFWYIRMRVGNAGTKFVTLTPRTDKGIRGWIMEPVMPQGIAVPTEWTFCSGTQGSTGYRPGHTSFPQAVRAGAGEVRDAGALPQPQEEHRAAQTERLTCPRLRGARGCGQRHGVCRRGWGISAAASSRYAKMERREPARMLQAPGRLPEAS
jgi:hypothetical protein